MSKCDATSATDEAVSPGPDPRRRLTLAALAAGLTAASLASGARAQGGPGESTLARVLRTKTLRVAGLVGEPQYFDRNIVSGEWSGAAIEMAKDLAKTLGVTYEVLESTYGNSVLQLQANQIDISLALTATPQRALSIDFTNPYFLHAYGFVSPKLSARTWADLNKPEVRLAVDLGSTQEVAARRFAPKAQITAFKNRDDVVLALSSGRVDAAIFAALLGLTAAKKNPSLGRFSMLGQPTVGLGSAFGIQKDADKSWRDFLNVWVDFNKGTGQMRDWLVGGMKIAGVEPDDIPPEVVF